MAGVIVTSSSFAVASKKASTPSQAVQSLPCRASVAKSTFARRNFAQQRGPWPAAATVAAAEVAEDVDDLEEEEASTPAAEDASASSIGFALNFLWMNKNIAVAVDQVFGKGQRSPVTEYYFWPRKDAWEELKVALEAKPWISARDKILLLNRTTEVINFWQTEGQKPSLEQAAAAFPDCVFKGS